MNGGELLASWAVKSAEWVLAHPETIEWTVKDARWLYANRQYTVEDFWGSREVFEPIDIPLEPQSRAAADFLHPTLGTTTYSSRGSSDLDAEQINMIGYRRFDDSTQGLRLLEVLTAESDDEQLACRLHHESTATRPLYVALSYEWGSGTDRNIIILNDVPTTITANLYQFLWQYRRRGRTACLLWVDQLCLNQSDEEEKSQQIPRMRIIYNQAQECIVWLGHSEEDDLVAELSFTIAQLTTFRQRLMAESPEAARAKWLDSLIGMWLAECAMGRTKFATFNRLRRSVRNQETLTRVLNKLGREMRDKDAAILELRTNFLLAACAVCRMSYWRRAWITQEVVVSRQVRIWSASHAFALDTFVTLLDEMLTMGALTMRHSGVARVHNLQITKEIYRLGEPINLLEALHATYGTRCAWRHDEVYAVLGLAYNHDRFIRTISYATPLGTVMQNMVETYIDSSSTLDLICLQPCRPLNPLKLPSWAPDLRIVGHDDFTSRMIQYLAGKDERAKLDGKRRFWFTSHASSVNFVKFLDTGHRKMIVRARLIGSISGLTYAAEPGVKCPSLRPAKAFKGGVVTNHLDIDMRDGSMGHQDRFVRRALHHLMTLRASPSDVDSRGDWPVWDLGLAASTSTVQTLRGVEQRPIKDERKHVLDWLAIHRSLMIADRSLEDWSRMRSWEYTANQSLPGAISHKLFGNDPRAHSAYGGALRDAVHRVIGDGMRLVVVEGSFLGWAHPRSQLHDEVYLIEGCSMPVVLRKIDQPNPISSERCVIGDAYIHGAMDGELWVADTRSLRNITLV